jgi:hypothetical protein
MFKRYLTSTTSLLNSTLSSDSLDFTELLNITLKYLELADFVDNYKKNIDKMDKNSLDYIITPGISEFSVVYKYNRIYVVKYDLINEDLHIRTFNSYAYILSHVVDTPIDANTFKRVSKNEIQ